MKWNENIHVSLRRKKHLISTILNSKSLKNFEHFNKS